MLKASASSDMSEPCRFAAILRGLESDGITTKDYDFENIYCLAGSELEISNIQTKCTVN